MCKNAYNIHILKLKPELQRDSFKAGLHLAWSSSSLQPSIYCLPQIKGRDKIMKKQTSFKLYHMWNKIDQVFPWRYTVPTMSATVAAWNPTRARIICWLRLKSPLRNARSPAHNTPAVAMAPITRKNHHRWERKPSLANITRRRLDAVTFNLWFQSYKPLLVQNPRSLQNQNQTTEKIRYTHLSLCKHITKATTVSQPSGHFKTLIHLLKNSQSSFWEILSQIKNSSSSSSSYHAPPEENKTKKPKRKGLQSFIADVQQKQTKKPIQSNTELPRGLQQEPLCQNSIIRSSSTSSGERKSTA